MYKYFFLLFSLSFLTQFSYADSLSAGLSTGLSNKADNFFSWLKKNEKTFIDCPLTKNKDKITLCDGTEVSYTQLKKLFNSTKKEILAEFKKEKINVELICDPNQIDKDLGDASCVSESSNQIFKKVTSLHGLYVPDENKIIAKSSGSRGTLIHEYLHALQSRNTNKIDGHIYKTEKNQLRQEIEKELDLMMADIKLLEKSKKKDELNKKVADFIKLNNYMLMFSPWQDLIDERSLFLLYVKYQKDFKIDEADVKLAQKNIQFICARKEFTDKLNSAECLN